MGTTIVELSGGNQAVIRDPLLITNGQRRPIVLAADRYLQRQITPEFAAAYKRAVAMNDQQRLLELAAAAQIDQSEQDVLKAGEVFITVMVEDWTLALPLPSEKPIYEGDMLVGSEVLDELLAHDYDRLQVAAASLITQTRWLGDPEEPAGKVKAPRAPQDRQRPSRARGSSPTAKKH